MPQPLLSLVTRLLDCGSAGPAKPVVDQLVKELCEITGVELHPALFLDEGASITANGKAVSPTTAAQCAEDVERTRVFMQGVYTALQRKLETATAGPVQVLYAGTGPFALLLVPLLPLFTGQPLRITLLDIHAESLAFLQRLLVALQLDNSELIDQVVCADACNWLAPHHYDLIMSETMRQGLLQEPQVRIFAHLQQFLKPDGWLLPQYIRLDLWLTRAGNENSLHHLGKIFQLDNITAAQIGNGNSSSLQGDLQIPAEPVQWRDLKLTTEICVLDNLVLRENQSQLTLPLYEKNIRIKPGCTLRYNYEQGTYPRFVFAYEKEPGSDELPLPDTREKSALGVYHLPRFWHKVQLRKRLSTETTRTHLALLSENDWQLDRILLDKLGVGLEPAMTAVYHATNMAEFERWIESNHGAALDPLIIERANCALLDCLENKKSILQHNNSPVLTETQLSHWDEQGYLIIPGVLAPHEAAAARTAIWDYLQMHERDPESWYRPAGEMKKIMVQLFAHPAFEVARQSPLVRAIFQQLWQRNDLVVTTDRVGFNPPETAQWQFPGPSIHWDVELQAPVPFGTQALIYLTDVAEHQGAFCCVPGFHKKIDQWLAQQPKGVDLQKQDWSQWPVKPIAARAGDLIIWHQALPHGSSPNRADFPRMVQYINMYAA